MAYTLGVLGRPRHAPCDRDDIYLSSCSSFEHVISMSVDRRRSHASRIIGPEAAPCHLEEIMSKARLERAIELSGEQRRRLIETLNNSDSRPDSRRASVRYDYEVAGIPVSIEHPGGGTTHYLVYGHDLSRGGMSVLHSGYVHPNASCLVLLRLTDGDTKALAGTTRHCRLISAPWHQIGIQFKKELDLHLVLGTGISDEVEAGQAIDADESLRGRVLVSEMSEPGRLLIERDLAGLGLALQTTATRGATLDAVQREGIDMVIVGVGLVHQDDLRMISRLREMRYKGPIVLVSAEATPQAIMRAREAGATTVVARPYSVDYLLTELRVGLDNEKLKTPMRSTMENTPGMKPLVQTFIQHTQRWASQIERHHELDVGRLRELCYQLKACGPGYGFIPLTIAAVALITALESNAPKETVEERVDRLVACCHALESAPPNASAAA
ncbi:MAG: response regulator [bacterium]|nr:response regulator [bacterium]